MRRLLTMVLPPLPGSASLLLADDLANPTTILAAVGTLVAGIVAAIAMLRRQDTDAAIKGLQDVVGRQEKTIGALQDQHALCEAKHAVLESRLAAVTGWLERNRVAMETSGVKLEPLPNLQ